MAIAQALCRSSVSITPVSCAAVIQACWRAVQTGRCIIVGTCVGASARLGVAAAAARRLEHILRDDGAGGYESLVVRHYGLAAVFITPMAIFLARRPARPRFANDADRRAIPSTRCWAAASDWSAGAIHNARLRETLGGHMRRLASARLS